MNLEELLRETDALTYINALKVVLIEIKDELSTQDELAEYLNDSRDKTRKLLRKADNHYRLIAKLVQKESPATTTAEIDPELQELMEET